MSAYLKDYRKGYIKGDLSAAELRREMVNFPWGKRTVGVRGGTLVFEDEGEAERYRRSGIK